MESHSFRREFGLGVLLFGWPILIIWLGSSALSHINELYDGLCAVHGPQMLLRLYDGDPRGYCTGIDSDLSLLSAIMLIASLSVPVVIVLVLYIKTAHGGSRGRL